MKIGRQQEYLRTWVPQGVPPNGGGCSHCSTAQCKAKAQALPWSSQASQTYESLEEEQLSSVLASSHIPVPGVMLQGLSLWMPLQLSYFISELI